MVVPALDQVAERGYCVSRLHTALAWSGRDTMLSLFVAFPRGEAAPLELPAGVSGRSTVLTYEPPHCPAGTPICRSVCRRRLRTGQFRRWKSDQLRAVNRPGLLEGLNPREDETYASTEEVSAGAS